MIIINDRKHVVSQILDGIIFLYADQLKRISETNIITQKEVLKNQVCLLSGSGSGHEPADFGYIGEGMLSASVSGELFSSPKQAEILNAIRLLACEKGVLLIVKNFEEDVREFLAAEKEARAEGILVEHVIVNDDCSVEKFSLKKRRRGVAGTVLVHKILGSAAKRGLNLQELKKLGERVVMAMNTLGVATSSATLLGTNDEPLFVLPKDHVSYGVGIHGEAGYRTEKIKSSENLANELLNKLFARYSSLTKYPFAILINNLGNTTALELSVFANDVSRLLKLNEVNVAMVKSGNFLTSINMSGISLTLLELREDEWIDYLKAETTAFGWS